MKYPDELKREAHNLAAQPGMTVAQVERDLASGYEGGASKTWSTVIVRIKTYYGARVETAYCKV